MCGIDEYIAVKYKSLKITMTRNRRRKTEEH